MSDSGNLLVKNCGQLLTLARPERTPRTGPALSDIGLVEGGALAVRDGRVALAGTLDDARRALEGADGCLEIDADGAVVMPGFVDCHTHTVFARYRLDEYEWRVGGTPYAEIAARGGGIAKSVEHVREMDADSLFAVSARRLAGCTKYGTTTIEIKSGYGLDLENELKQLRVIRRLDETHPQTIVATFLGAHALPASYLDNREEFIKVLQNEMIPMVVGEGLAEFNDVFSETGVFTTDEAERILRTGQQAGLKARLHADELNDTGSAELAANIGAVTADHLTRISDRGIKRMQEAGVFGVLLPGTSFGLPSLHFAPARKMIDAGMRIAVATDFNPGSSPSESMPMMISISCSHLRMSPAEAISATTYNPAFVLGRQNDVGSLEAGKRADFLILACEDYREIANRFGINPVQAVYIEGRRWRSGA